MGHLIGQTATALISTLTALALIALWVSGLALGRRVVPQIDRETSQRLLDRRPVVWATLNGALLGVGFTSRIGFVIWYVVPIAAFASREPLAGSLIFGSYGMARLSTVGAVALWVRAKPQSGVIDRLIYLHPAAIRATDVLSGLLVAAMIVTVMI